MTKHTITVAQERGKDSTVEVFEEVRDAFAGPQSFLCFFSDQALTTGSGRALEVNEAIEAYCVERGYRLGEQSKYQIEARYDVRQHSATETFKIETAIRKDPRYMAVVEQAQAAAAVLNSEYGDKILQLKNLVRTLEQKLNGELQKERDRLLALQVTIVQETELPQHVSIGDTKRLLEPKHPLVRLQYDRSIRHAEHYGLPPSDISEILEMVKDV